MKRSRAERMAAAKRYIVKERQRNEDRKAARRALRSTLVPCAPPRRGR
jgi:hypothetical protein